MQTRIVSVVVVAALAGCRGTTTELELRLVALEDEVAALAAENETLRADLDAATTRLEAAEAAIVAQSADLDTLGDDIAGLSGGVTFTELADGLDAVDDRVTTLEDAGFATQDWVEAQGYGAASDIAANATRLTALESADLATRVWVQDQGYATASTHAADVARIDSALAANASSAAVLDSRVDAVDQRLTALESAGLATEAWVASQGYLGESDVALLESELLELGQDLGGLAVAVGQIEDELATGGYATELWITSQGFLTADDLWDIGRGLEVVNDVLQVDDAEIQGLATDAAYDTVAELRAALDGIYLTPEGGSAVDLLFGASVLLGEGQADCDADHEGLIRYMGGAFQGCSASGWVTLGGGGFGTSPDDPAPSCLDIRLQDATAPSGAYWLDGPTGAYQAYCDMDTASGGWTLIATMYDDDATHRWHAFQPAWKDDSVFGSTTANPNIREDTKSPAFSTVAGRELLIYYKGQPLLYTSGGCLPDQPLSEFLAPRIWDQTVQHACTVPFHDESLGEKALSCTSGTSSCGPISELYLHWGESHGQNTSNSDQVMISSNRRASIHSVGGLGARQSTSGHQCGTCRYQDISEDNDVALNLAGEHFYAIFVR